MAVEKKRRSGVLMELMAFPDLPELPSTAVIRGYEVRPREVNYAPDCLRVAPRATQHFALRLDESPTNGDENSHQVELTGPLPAVASDPKGVFDWKEILTRIVFIGLYLFDVGSDYRAAYIHFMNGDSLFFIVTLLFIFLPGFATSAISLKFYWADERGKKNRKQKIKRWTVIAFFLVATLSPVLKDIDGLRYGFKMRRTENPAKRRKYFQRLSKEDEDKYLLKLLLALLEDGPQLIIQFIALALPNTASTTYDRAKLVLPMVFSLVGLAATHACYHKNLRRLKSKENEQLSWPVTLFIAAWSALFLLARVLALGLWGMSCPVRLICVIVHRWIVMNVWIKSMDNKYCNNKIQDILYHLLLGGVFIFLYLNLKGTPTRRRQFFFYLYTFVENSIMMITWHCYVDPSTWYRVPAMLIHFLSFFGALMMLVIYYLFLHPKAKCGFTLKTSENVPTSNH